MTLVTFSPPNTSLQYAQTSVNRLAVRYQVSLIVPGLSAVLPMLFPLEPFRGPLILQDNPGELAQKLSFNVNNQEIPGVGWLHQACGLNAQVLCNQSTDAGATWTECFRGTIKEWEYDEFSNPYFTVTAYDILVNMQQSKFENMWSLEQNNTYADIVQTLCSVWGVPLVANPLPGLSNPVPQITWTGPLGGFLLALLGQVAVETGHAYLFRATGSQVDIILPGTNQPVYSFDATNTKSAPDQESIMDLVTEIQSTGFNNDITRTPLTSVITNAAFPPATWGHVREIVQTMASGDSQLVQINAERILSQHGLPKRLRKVISNVDVPSIRKGDMVYLDNCGVMNGYYGNVGVTHNEGDGTMTLEINFSGMPDYIIQRFDPSVSPNATYPSLTPNTVPQAGSLVPQLLQWIRTNLADKQYVPAGGHDGNWAAGVDCSGMVDVALAAVGITVTDGQGTDGFLENKQLTILDQSQLQPGDLVIFGKIWIGGEYTGHVGIVIEDPTKIIEFSGPNAGGAGRGMVDGTSIESAKNVGNRGIAGYRRVPGLNGPQLSSAVATGLSEANTPIPQNG